MATVLTVHGTFASGPPEGNKWWQKGSAFTRHIAELVAADRGGSLTVVPYVWDGRNSERSRRAAGRELYQRLAELEQAGEPVCVVGHSHGGSVIAAALMESARQRNPLRCLSRWVTIGTPFIRTERQRLLFLRLGLLGKAAYLSMLLFTLLGALALTGSAALISRDSWPIALASMFGPFIAFRLLLMWVEKRQLFLYNRRTVSFAAEHHRPRWLSLWQADDEAVQGLRAVKSLDFDLFPRAFAVGPLSLLSLLLFPLLCLMLLHSEPAMNAIADRLFVLSPGDAAAELYPARGKDLGQNALVLLLAAAVLPASFVFSKELFVDGHSLLAIVFFGLAALLFMAAAILLTLLVMGLAHMLSALLSRILNPTTRAQIRARAYGSDTQEDRAVDAADWPMWLGGGFPPLPEPLGAELQRVSDAAIGQRMSKFRDAIRALSSVSSRDERSDMLSEYLTWNELIHTSYFDHPRFRKLLAFAIAQGEGFRPSDAFLADPEFEIVGRLHDELVAGAGGIA